MHYKVDFWWGFPGGCRFVALNVRFINFNLSESQFFENEDFEDIEFREKVKSTVSGGDMGSGG